MSDSTVYKPFNISDLSTPELKNLYSLIGHTLKREKKQPQELDKSCDSLSEEQIVSLKSEFEEKLSLSMGSFKNS